MDSDTESWGEKFPSGVGWDSKFHFSKSGCNTNLLEFVQSEYLRLKAKPFVSREVSDIGPE